MALLIAAVCEVAGALIAGSEVVGTIRGGIIDPKKIADAQTFVWLMLAALFAAALWLNIATSGGAPVSTTHSIVGAVLGAGLAAAGVKAVHWEMLGNIVLSWVVSPVMGGIIAAGFLYLLKHLITYRQDKAGAARRFIPWIVATMSFVFTTYLLLKGLNIYKTGLPTALGVGAGVAALVFVLTRFRYHPDRNLAIENSRHGVNRLFTVPLIFAAGLLSFAHGSNDVANAVGPLAAIIDTVHQTTEIAKSANVPLWVLVMGGIGIAFGLALFGPRLIRTVGTEITELDPMRAFAVAMAAAITVIIASQLGLPVSSTHIAVGGVFGVGFLREYLKTNYARMLEEICRQYPETTRAELDAFVDRFENATFKERGEILRELKLRQKKEEESVPLTKVDRKTLKSVYKTELVKRSLVIRIAAAWVITVPASAILAAMLFYMLRGMLL
jgi:PiT family inorganic phosphate transporter